jgi:hypothetical protein
MVLLISGAGWVAGSAPEAQAQELDSLCVDTLAAAEAAYRSRNYQEAVALASQCTD